MTTDYRAALLERFDVHCHREDLAETLLGLLIEAGIPDAPDGLDMDAIYDNPKYAHLRRKAA